MFRLPAIFLFVLILAHGADAQRTISGTVVEGDSGNPVPGASVFISNTSKGTVSNREGVFQLTDLPVGQQELIVSSIGFETNSFSFSSEKLPLKVVVKLQVKVRELANVTVEPSVLEGWEKWGKLFTDNFVGQTPNASKCRIRNYKAIRFRYFKKSNRVIAWCDEPLIVENKALGYTLRYQLESFEVSFSEHTTTFAGYPFFEDHQPFGKKLRSRWQRERDQAYAGSMLEFMRSVYNNTITAAGYEVRRMVRRPNYEKQRVKEIYRGLHGASARPPSGLGGTITLRVGSPGGQTPAPPPADTVIKVKAGYPADNNGNVDSSGYYERILGQEDFIDTYASSLLTADSLIVERDSSYKAVWFDDYLFITYKKEIEERSYLEQYHEKRSPAFQRSHIWLVNKSPIVIDAKGSYSPPQEVFSMSYWGWSEKIAELLPIDYEPSKK